MTYEEAFQWMLPGVASSAHVYIDECLNHGITSAAQHAMLLAQLAHESLGGRWLIERGDGTRYEGRKDLGNLIPGDGPRFKGRGLIQLTGRANYQRAEDQTGIRLVDHPELAAIPPVAVRIAVWFFVKSGCLPLCDDVVKCTQRINGGLNGLDDRRRLWCQAKSLLGVVP